MKISVLTPTYNRGELLKRVYNSLVENSDYGVQIEWLIMDDGSTDNTQEIVENFEKGKIDIKFFKQKNQGKMSAINNLVEHATGDLIVDCDSDDYFTKDAFKIIAKEYENKAKEDEIETINQKHDERKSVYGFCFLKYNSKGENMGKNFKMAKTTMFDLYFKEGEDGEKAIVFYSNIRKEFKHELEHGENFITEGRMYHKMDEKYKIICVNKPIMICEYQEKGYSQNIKEQFIKNPYGYYEYFKEILQKDMKRSFI